MGNKYSDMCRGCRYKGTKGGCIKFSLSKEEINKGWYVHTNNMGSYFMEGDCRVRERRR